MTIDTNIPASGETQPATEASAVIGSPVGLHARPAANLVKAAKRYASDIRIGRPGADPVDAKSILKVLGLGAGYGEEVIVSAKGEDAAEAVGELTALVQAGDD